jgi:hypothetical protein
MDTIVDNRVIHGSHFYLLFGSFFVSLFRYFFKNECENDSKMEHKITLFEKSCYLPDFVKSLLFQSIFANHFRTLFFQLHFTRVSHAPPKLSHVQGFTARPKANVQGCAGHI